MLKFEGITQWKIWKIQINPWRKGGNLIKFKEKDNIDSELKLSTKIVTLIKRQ